jgi:hypothetical protein
MNKLSPRQKAASETAAAQRNLCLDWLLFIMSKSSVKMRTKEDLRAEAIERFKISKQSFDVAWTWAIEETGNRHWYDPLPKSRKRAGKTWLS